jgi:hypothetical protein
MSSISAQPAARAEPPPTQVAARSGRARRARPGLPIALILLAPVGALGFVWLLGPAHISRSEAVGAIARRLCEEAAAGPSRDTAATLAIETGPAASGAEPERELEEKRR